MNAIALPAVPKVDAVDANVDVGLISFSGTVSTGG